MNTAKIEALELSQSPTEAQRATTRQFLRENVHQLLGAGSATATRYIISLAFTQEAVEEFSAALRTMEQRCCNDEALHTIELYEDGINAFIRRNGVEHAVCVLRWRRQVAE